MGKQDRSRPATNSGSFQIIFQRTQLNMTRMASPLRRMDDLKYTHAKTGCSPPPPVRYDPLKRHGQHALERFAEEVGGYKVACRSRLTELLPIFPVDHEKR